MALTKTELNKEQALTKINNFIDAFQTWVTNPESPTVQDLEKFLTNDFQLFSNGELEYRDLYEYLESITVLRDKYSQLEISGPFDVPFVADNQAVITYEVNLVSEEEGEKSIFTMAVVTFQGDKISKWVQTTHNKEHEQWG